jgi:hypothetical protein
MRKPLGKLGGATVGTLLHAATHFLLLSAAFILLSPAICHAQNCGDSFLPRVTAVTPSTWNVGKATNITITGNNFNPIAGFMGGDPKGIYCTQTQVSIGVDTGSVTVSNVNIVSTTEITATVTPDASDPTETACVTAPGMTVYMVVKTPTSAMSAASAAGSVCTDPNIEPIYGNKGIRVQIIGCPAPTITDVKPST